MLARRALVAMPLGHVLSGQRSQMFGNAEPYERFMGRWSRLLAPIFVDFADLPANGRILDVGSGTGALAFEIARRGTATKIVGIDPSEEYVAYANSRNAHRGRVQFQTGDAQMLKFSDRAFDACASLLVFNFIPDAAKALRELRRTTKPRGVIAAAVWDYGDGMRMLRAFWNAAVQTDAEAERVDEKKMPLCRVGELSQAWKTAELEQVREQPLEASLHFSNFADYWEPFLLGQGPAGAYVRRLDDTKRKALRAAVQHELGVEETTAFMLPARVWAVRGIVP